MTETDLRCILVVDDENGQSFAFGPWLKESADQHCERIRLAFPKTTPRVLPLLSINTTRQLYPIKEEV